MYQPNNLLSLQCADGTLVYDRDVLKKHSLYICDYLAEFPTQTVVELKGFSNQSMTTILAILSDNIQVIDWNIDWTEVFDLCAYLELTDKSSRKLRDCLARDIVPKFRLFLPEDISLVNLVRIWENPTVYQDCEYRICDIEGCNNRFVPLNHWTSRCETHRQMKIDRRTLVIPVVITLIIYITIMIVCLSNDRCYF